MNGKGEPMDDLISRQAAIDICRAPHMRNADCSDFEMAIMMLPPAQPEPHWIPVTEATPTEDDDYWATFEAETGRFVDWASWYQGRWVVWIEGSPAPLSNVIAWCKPMEPYKEVTT
jgi:hypothetical protein